MNYTVKSALIICAVALVSFFVAELVIPEKDAAARNSEPANPADVDIPVVVADDTPAEAPAIPRETALTAVTKAVPPPAKTVPPTKAAPTPETKTAPPAPPVTKTASVFAPPDAAQGPGARKTASGVSAETIIVCAAVEEKAPVGVSNKFSAKDTKQVYFYTIITGARDTTAIVHRWYHNGKLIQTSPLSVRSAHWRTHSKRNLYSTNAPDPVGEWRVDVVEGKTGQVMGSTNFTVVE